MFGYISAIYQYMTLITLILFIILYWVLKQTKYVLFYVDLICDNYRDSHFSQLIIVSLLINIASESRSGFVIVLVTIKLCCLSQCNPFYCFVLIIKVY